MHRRQACKREGSGKSRVYVRQRAAGAAAVFGQVELRTPRCGEPQLEASARTLCCVTDVDQKAIKYFVFCENRSHSQLLTTRTLPHAELHRAEAPPEDISYFQHFQLA